MTTVVAGNETQVNTTTTGDQNAPSTTGLSDGGWVVTWHGVNPVDGTWDIYQQRYAADGTASGGEVVVNTTITGDETYTSTTALPDGGWLVTWSGDGATSGSPDIYQQRYDSAGIAIGGEAVVNTSTIADQNAPSVTTLSDGGWVVTWYGVNVTNKSYDIFQQRYDFTGAATGNEIVVNTTITNDQAYPSTTALTDGGWVVTWSGFNPANETIDVFQQRYDSAGGTVGGEVVVNTTTRIEQSHPSTTALPDGGWVVTWYGFNFANETNDIYQQRYDSDGVATGGEVIVNTTLQSDQKDPSTTALADGGWVVTWSGVNAASNTYDIYQQRFGADGVAIGGEEVVNTTTANNQYEPSTTALADGGWVVTWYGLNATTGDNEVYQRRYSLENEPPTLTGSLSATVAEGDSHTIAASELGYKDPDDGDADVTFTVSSLANGTLMVDGKAATSFTCEQLAAGKVAFVHDGSETTSAGFNVSVEDGDEDKSTPTSQAFTITVDPVNDAPTGPATGALSPDGTEDTTYSLAVAKLLTGFTDVDDKDLSVTGLKVTAGSASVADDGKGGYLVTPDANFNGDVTLSYTVTDGHGGDVTVTRTLTFDPVNDAPTGPATGVLSPDGTEDTTYSLAVAKLLTGFTDVDDKDLSVTGLKVTGGNATVADDGKGGYLVTPAQDFNGDVTLSYTVTDGHGGDVTVTRTLTFDPVNDAPTGPATGVLSPDGTEDTGYTLAAATLLTGFTDVDDKVLSVTGLKVTAGSASVADDGKGGYLVTPDQDFNGDVTLSYTVTDGHGGDISVIRTLTFDPVNDAPTGPATGVLSPDGTEDTGYTLAAATLLTGFTDVDDKDLSVTGLKVTGGNATVADDGKGGYLVTPDANFNGDVTLSYTVTDGHGGDVTVTRTLTFDPVNDAPTGLATGVLSPDGTEDTGYTLAAATLLTGFTDVDDKDLSVTGLKVTGGNATVADDGKGGYLVTPDADFNGDVTLSYTVTDGHGGDVTVTRTLTFDPVNDAPTGPATGVLSPDGTEDTTYPLAVAKLLTGFTDVDDKVLSVTGLKVTAGSASVADDGKGGYLVTPDQDFNGDVTLSYTVTDGHGGDISVIRTLTFDPVNDAPTGPATGVLSPDGTEDTGYTLAAATLLTGFTDVDDKDLSVTGLKVTGGNATVADDGKGGYLVTPDADFNGDVTLSYTVTDGHGGDVTVTRTLTFDPVNDAPELLNPLSNQRATEDTPFTFAMPGDTFGDVDAGDVLSYTATLANGDPLPSWLTFDPTTNTFSGTPHHADIGSVSVTVTATDTGGLTASSNFDIAVSTGGGGLGDILLSNDTVKENSDAGTVVGKLSVPDADAGDTLTYTLSRNPDNAFAIVDGKLVVADGADLDYESRKHYRITVHATESDGSHFREKFTIDVKNVNETPIGTPDDDVLIGDSSRNDIHGRQGADIVKGMGGSDRLRSDLGNDHLWGNSGADTFFFGPYAGHDVVEDFNHEGDRINLKHVNGIKDFDDLMKHHVEARDNGVLITSDDGSTMLLKHVDSHDLKANDFIF